MAAKLASKRRDLRALRQPAGEHDLSGGVGLLLADQGLGDRDHAAASGKHGLGTPPGDELGDALLEGMRRPRSRSGRGAFETSARRRGTGFTARSACARGTSCGWPMTRQSWRARSSRRGLGPAADIERDVARRRDGREDVRARHVAHVDHVHGLQAVAEDDRRLAARQGAPSSAPAPRCSGRGCPCAGRRR